MAIEDLLAMSASGAMQNAQTNPPMTAMAPQPMQQPPPQPQFRPPPVQYGQAGNEFQTVGGRKRADKEALFHSIAGLVKQGSSYIQEKKNRALSMDIERMLSAQQGRQEAVQALQQNPNDPNAKAAFEKNTQILNDIAKDPKKSKQIEKAFNISLLGGDKSKNKEENKALIDAWKNFDEKDKGRLNPVAQRMMDQQPQRQQLSPEAQQQMLAIKTGMQPDANAKLQSLAKDADRVANIQMEKAREANDLKIAEMASGKIGGEGVNVVDTDPSSVTGIQRLQMSPDGKNIRRTQNVVLPSILPSEHEGISTLVVPDPNSPTGSSIARIPNPSSTHKQIPGVGTVGQGGIVQRQRQGQGGGGQPGSSLNRTKNVLQAPGSTPDGKSKAKALGLPPGSTVISAKALSPAQVGKYKEGITAIDGTIEILQKIRDNTDIYSDMFKAGKIKLAIDPKSGQRILGSFLPSTDEEKRAAAVWQSSAEYMNTFRGVLNAQGFRGKLAYDNMVNLRGQLWQDKVILNETLDNSISFMKKELSVRKKLIGEAEDKTVDEKKTEQEKLDPGGFFVNKK